MAPVCMVCLILQANQPLYVVFSSISLHRAILRSFGGKCLGLSETGISSCQALWHRLTFDCRTWHVHASSPRCYYGVTNKLNLSSLSRPNAPQGGISLNNSKATVGTLPRDTDKSVGRSWHLGHGKWIIEEEVFLFCDLMKVFSLCVCLYKKTILQLSYML